MMKQLNNYVFLGRVWVDVCSIYVKIGSVWTYAEIFSAIEQRVTF